MRYLLPLLLLAVSVRAQSDDHLICKIAELEAQAAVPHFSANARSAVPDNYNQVYQRCYWTVDPVVQYIAGDVTTHFKPHPGGLNTLGFDLSLNLSVDSVVYHGQRMPFTHEADDLLEVFFPITLPGTMLDSVRVYYHGAPEKSGFGTFVTELHQQTPVLWTLSEPYGAREWWPCKQDLIDKIDSIDIFVRAPAAYSVASNGLLQSVANAGPDRIHHWKTRYPIAAYLVAIGVTNYAIYSDFAYLNGDTLAVLNYVYPESLSDATQNTPAIAEILNLFTEKAGAYPFIREKYGHAQFGFGGGMEHQTMSFMVGFSYGLMAHEAAHQWFGNGITCGSWQDIWLNEGFATYFEGLTREAYFPPSTWYSWKSGKLSSIVSAPGGSVFCTDTTDVYRVFSGRLSYNKGAYVLHMLRFVLGDDAFFTGIRNYMDDPNLRYGYARTSDLKAHLEAASGKNLDAFFDQWVYGEGYPSYDLTWSHSDDGWWSGYLTQQSTSVPASVPFFDIPVPVRLSYDNWDTTIVMLPNSHADLLTPYPKSVSIDPDLWIISANNTVNELVGTNAAHAGNRLRLHPNPGSERLWIDVPAGSRVQIFDISGRLVFNHIYTGTALEVAVLKPGAYEVLILPEDKHEKTFSGLWIKMP